jgi:hypothetical protein
MLKRTKWNALRDRWAKARDAYVIPAKNLTPEDLNVRIRILMAHAYDLGRRDQRAVTNKKLSGALITYPRKRSETIRAGGTD